MADSAERIGAGRYDELEAIPEGTVTTACELTTSDGAKVPGLLRVPDGATTVAALMHPRASVDHHALVPHLLSRGLAVWTQGPRSVNNDVNLLHEQALIDYAAGQSFLRESGFAHVIGLGHSGGATLTAFYCQQAALAAGDRLSRAPSGKPVPLPDTQMPQLDGVVFMAPHPGQPVLLSRVIDPSVADEDDPLSVRPEFDAFDAANGFVPAPESSSYSADFIAAYRQAQLDRITRIDERAWALVEQARTANARFKSDGEAGARRAGLAPRLITVFRTDADPRNVDLSLDPNRRPYGSLFGRRPDLTNYGLVGFGRISTADAWLSTWSVHHSNATFLRCAPDVTIPTLLIEFTGDQASFPSDIEQMRAALGASDLSFDSVPGTHFGGPIEKGAPSGSGLAARVINAWLTDRWGAS